MNLEHKWKPRRNFCEWKAAQDAIEQHFAHILQVPMDYSPFSELYDKTLEMMIASAKAQQPIEKQYSWFEPVTDENRADWEAQAESIRNSGQSQP